jgi:hypothetical protein
VLYYIAKMHISVFAWLFLGVKNYCFFLEENRTPALNNSNPPLIFLD